MTWTEYLAKVEARADKRGKEFCDVGTLIAVDIPRLIARARELEYFLDEMLMAFEHLGNASEATAATWNAARAVLAKGVGE